MNKVSAPEIPALRGDAAGQSAHLVVGRVDDAKLVGVRNGRVVQQPDPSLQLVRRPASGSRGLGLGFEVWDSGIRV
jgi:hypothetical protein